MREKLPQSTKALEYNFKKMIYWKTDSKDN